MYHFWALINLKISKYYILRASNILSLFKPIKISKHLSNQSPPNKKNHIPPSKLIIKPPKILKIPSKFPYICPTLNLNEINVHLPGLVRQLFHEIIRQKRADLYRQQFHRNVKIEKVDQQNPQYGELVLDELVVALVLVFVFFGLEVGYKQ